MATSGSFTHSIKTGYRLVVEWSATQSTANNTSTVTAKLYLQSLSSGYNIISSADKTAWIEIDGNRSTKNDTNVTLDGNQKKLMHTHVRTLSHNSDGTKSFTLRASQEFGFTFAGSYTGTVTTSIITFNLTTIPRSSTFDFVSIPTIRDDILQDMTINISRVSTTFTHRLSLYAGSTFVQSWSGLGGGNQTVTLTTTGRNRILDAMPTSTSGTFQFRLRTYDSSNAVVGSDHNRNRTLFINTSVVRPTLGSITITEANTTVANSQITNWVQGISQPRISVPTYSAPRGATVASIRVTFDGSSSTVTNPSGTVTRTFNAPNSGTRSISVVVTDSRGLTNSNTSQGSIVVYSYQPPNITKYNVYRSDLSGNPVEDSTRVAVDRAVSIHTIGNQNRVRYRLSRRERGLTTWTVITNWTSYATSSTGLTTHTTYALDKSWEFRIEFQDYLRTTISIADVPSESVTMSWGVLGVGVGKIWEHGALDIRGDLFLEGNLKGGRNDIRLDFYSNTTALNSRTWFEMWQTVNADGSPAGDRVGEFTFGAGHFAWRTGSTDTATGTERMVLDNTSLTVNGRIQSTPSGGVSLNGSSYADYGVLIANVISTATVYVDVDKNTNGFRIRKHSGGQAYANIMTLSPSGDFSVTGNKNVIQETPTYGKRLMNALETPDSRFVTYMEMILPVGTHTIPIEPMFAETISEFFVVPHVQFGGDVKLLSKTDTSFTVEVTGDETDVVIEVNGRRVGFEDQYMEPIRDPDQEIVVQGITNIKVTGIKGGDANE